MSAATPANAAPRRIAGYAAIFDKADKGGDVIRRGAFAGADPSRVGLYWQHDPRRRIGEIESLSEDERGLRMIARLSPDAPPVSQGHGLSFGYRARQVVNGTYRELMKLELIEISLVANPMQPLATLLAVAPLPQLERVFHEGEDDGL